MAGRADERTRCRKDTGPAEARSPQGCRPGARGGDNPRMSDENQIEIPPSFIALFVEPGRIKPNATRAEITRRYEFCEALATMLVERAQTLQWQLGITEADVLERLHAGLRGPDAPVPPNEGEWIISRLAELLEWERPKWKAP